MVEETVTQTEATTDITEQGTTAPQEIEKPGLTQEEVDKLIQIRVGRERAKLDKKYSGIDLDKYHQLVEEEDKRKLKEAEKRGEFDKVIKEQAEKFNAKIGQYQTELTSIKVDGALLNAASKLKAINPEQVVTLLKGQLKLNDAGAVDVVDTNGQVRYNEKGDPISVDDLTQEFLTANAHFVSAGPSGAGTQGATGKITPVEFDVSKLDMNNPEDRKKYSEYRKEKGMY